MNQEYIDLAPIDDPTLTRKALRKYKIGSFGKDTND